MRKFIAALSVLGLVLANGMAWAASITVNFTAGANATSHRVERKVDSGVFTSLGTLTMPTVQHTDATVTNDHLYCYRAVAISAFGESTPSTECCQSTFPPGTPTGMTCTLNP